jgi:hypothetical protein
VNDGSGGISKPSVSTDGTDGTPIDLSHSLIEGEFTKANSCDVRDAMAGSGHNPDRDFSAGDPKGEIDRRLLDPNAWGEPLSYVDLLTSPSVQSRIAKLIVQSTLERQRRGRGRRSH